jgi:serine O-acetyltransferase
MLVGFGVEQFCENSLNRIVESLSLQKEDVCILDDLRSELCQAFRVCYMSQKRPHLLGPYNVDAQLTFCVVLSRLLYRNDFKMLAEMLYYYTRTTFACDIYPARELPECFLGVHPLGTVLGNAQYGNRLVFYQQVTIGGNPKLEYPIIGDDVVLYSKASVIGSCKIGSNTIVGAGVTLINEEVPCNVVVFMDGDIRNVKANARKNHEDFFK